MISRRLIAVLVFVVVFVGLGAFVLYQAVLGETEGASETLRAPTLAPTLLATAVIPTETRPAETATASPPPTAELIVTEPTAETRLFEIVAAQSEARFTIFEMLRGSPKNVVGVTNQVAAQVSVNFGDLSQTQVGEVLINARTLSTDDERRNQAIRNRILFTDQYEYIRFQPIEIRGLSGRASPGQSYTFQILGELTIRDITQEVVFEVVVVVESLDRLSGQAKAVIRRADFNLIVPNVPFVADVGEEVELTLDFVLAPLQ